MSEERRYYSTRTLIDYTNFLGLTGDCRIITIDGGALAILRKLAERGLWPSTYYVERGVDYYTVPDSNQLDVVENVLAEFLKESSMTCTSIESVLASLQVSLAQIAQKDCCQAGTGSAGATTPYTGEPQDPGTYILPDKTLIETQGYKCDMAHQIVDELIADVNSLASHITGGVDLTAAAVLLAAVFLTPVPFDDIVAIAALALGAIVAGFTLPGIATALSDNRADGVCAMVNADTVAAAQLAFYNVIAPELTAPAQRVVLWQMETNESFGRLFKDVGKPLNNTGNTCNCVCYPLVPVEPESENGFVELDVTDVYDLTSGLVSTTHWGTATVNWDLDATCGPKRKITVNNLVGFNADTPWGFRIYDDDLTTLLYSSNTPPTEVLGRRIQIKSTTAFTAKLELSD